jgi:hypothetical protein
LHSPGARAKLPFHTLRIQASMHSRKEPDLSYKGKPGQSQQVDVFDKQTLQLGTEPDCKLRGGIQRGLALRRGV